MGNAFAARRGESLLSYHIIPTISIKITKSFDAAEKKEAGEINAFPRLTRYINYRSGLYAAGGT